MTNLLLATQSEQRARLASALRQLNAARAATPLDFLISPCEVIERHGTGALLQHIFPGGSGFFCLRSHNLYEGSQIFGDAHACLHAGSDADLASRVREAVGDHVPRRILSVPYFTDDVRATIALKGRFDVPLCTYIMDDQNVLTGGLSDADMRELLARSDIRFGISQALCEAYEAKYGLKFWFLPSVVPASLILDRVECPREVETRRGVLLGNIWSQQWLEQLRTVTRNSGARLDWYGDPKREWLSFDEAELERDGISFRGYLPEGELIERLRRYPFAVVTIGASDEPGDRPEFARLSLPSRMPYLTATAHAPIIVLGRTDSAAGQFLEALGTGLVSPYGPSSFLAAINHVCQPEIQLRMRERACAVARVLSAEGIAEWIWTSLARGEPADTRFETLLPRRRATPVASEAPRTRALQQADVVITGNEVTAKHGTGALVGRMFGASHNILSIRSFNHYGGDHHFGDVSVCLDQTGLSRPEVFRIIGRALGEHTVRRVLCVPYFLEDVLTAIAVKDICGVPLATYIMDDQNVCVDRLDDALMREFLGKCSIRFATHPELRDAYERKFGLKFWLLPAVVPAHLIDVHPSRQPSWAPPPNTAALMGSIWSERWFEMLWQTARGAGITLDWYGHFEYYWQRDSHDELRQKGIHVHGVWPEGPLTQRLRAYPYAIVPTGTLDERDDRIELSELSLPGRIIFAMATAHTPILVLGHRRTPAARFVERFRIGEVCDYEPEALRRTVEHLTRPDIQRELRANAARLARSFSDAGIAEWVWDALEREEPPDLRFEELMPRAPQDTVPFVESSVPGDVPAAYGPVYHVMRRLGRRGVRPDFVIDVGTTHGIWSYAASRAFPDARFILVDPLLSEHERRSEDPHLARIPRAERLEVPMDTLDAVLLQRGLEGRGILRLDGGCAHRFGGAGTRGLLGRLDGVVVEISLAPGDFPGLVLGEALPLLEGLGYRYYDETGSRRSAHEGRLLQKEIMFLRWDLAVPQRSPAP